MWEERTAEHCPAPPGRGIVSAAESDVGGMALAQAVPGYCKHVKDTIQYIT